ncbi:hypothetical protein ASPTUDRAFT_79951 [Aspergillus tubingensis CBS 134.48]|uniref:Uncharacterized protein n=1 Tax=Aspergillus tubingensis (strain CBS 134.48) TaxID=767770 RepID=A0A1L9NI90_ASPTC|nr:hypothetical protein ASPTUDRAFT_79951 [Aspergillus tubingensis CBS 134.48]
MASVHFGHRGLHCATREWVGRAQPGSPEKDRFGTNEQLQMVFRPRESLEDPSGPDWSYDIVQATMSAVPWFRRVFRQIPATLNDELYTLRLDPGRQTYSSDVVQHSALQRINLPMRRLGPVGRYASTKMIYETSTAKMDKLFNAQAVGVARILSHQPGPWYTPVLGWGFKVPGSL